MAITRMNHAVLYVRDATESAAFYADVLGFRVVMEMGNGAAMFLQAPDSSNDHDLGLFSIGTSAGQSTAGRSTVGLYHLAWEVDTLDALERVGIALSKRDALVGATNHGTTKSFYGRDVDGLEFEVAWIVPAHLLDDDALASRERISRLDIEAEKTRYGATTIGGIGISTPTPLT